MGPLAITHAAGRPFAVLGLGLWLLAAGVPAQGAAAQSTPAHEARAEQWRQTLASIADEFPDVPRIATADLAALLERDPDGVLLLDARSGSEYRVSHLPGAVLAGGTRRALARIRASDARTVVIYCSVGYRSARLAERLRKRGVIHVASLEGSLFKWFNEGRPVVRGDEPAHRVHPYNDDWGRLLDAPPD